MLAYRWRDARPDKEAASPDACEHSRKSRIICPDKAGVNVIQQFRIPVTCFQITKTNAVLASGKKIFCQCHNGVIGRNRHSAHRIKLTMSRALVGIEQCFPLIPLFAERRLTLVDSIFTAWFINMPIAVAIFYVGRRNFLCGMRSMISFKMRSCKACCEAITR